MIFKIVFKNGYSRCGRAAGTLYICKKSDVFIKAKFLTAWLLVGCPPLMLNVLSSQNKN